MYFRSFIGAPSHSIKKTIGSWPTLYPSFFFFPEAFSISPPPKKEITVHPPFLVGGFNPSEKYARQNGKSSANRVENTKYLEPPPSFCRFPWFVFFHPNGSHPSERPKQSLPHCHLQPLGPRPDEVEGEKIIHPHDSLEWDIFIFFYSLRHKKGLWNKSSNLIIFKKFEVLLYLNKCVVSETI